MWIPISCGNEQVRIWNSFILSSGPKFIKLLTGKQIFVLTVADKFAQAG